MARILLILFIAVSLGFYSKGCYSQVDNSSQEVSPAQSQIQEPYVWDFGTAQEGKVLEHTFVLMNNTLNLLNIKDLQASCSCAAFEVSTRQIPPGESAQIKVTFDTKGYEGRVMQYVYVQTDDPLYPIYKLTVTAEIIKN